jgi:heme-binding protein
MLFSHRVVHRATAGLICSGAMAAAMLFGGASSALAQPAPDPAPQLAPNCTAADLAQVSGNVGTVMGVYLFTHPDVNDFFTSLRGKPDDEIRGAVQDYMNAHPQVEAEITGIRQPLKDLKIRCEAPGELPR